MHHLRGFLSLYSGRQEALALDLFLKPSSLAVLVGRRSDCFDGNDIIWFHRRNSNALARWLSLDVDCNWLGGGRHLGH